MDRTQQLRDAALTKTAEATRLLRGAETDVETAVGRAAHWGATWAEIAAALGVTPQAAHKRFGHLRHDPASGPLADTTRTARDSTVSGNPPLTHRASHLDFPPLRGALSDTELRCSTGGGGREPASELSAPEAAARERSGPDR